MKENTTMTDTLLAFEWLRPDELQRGDVVPTSFGGVVSHVEQYGGLDHPTGHHPTLPVFDRRVVFTDGRAMSAESACRMRIERRAGVSR